MAKQSEPDTGPAAMDIFQRESDGNFEWIADAESLTSAKEKVVQNPASSDFAFLIVDNATREQTVVDPSDKPPDGIGVYGCGRKDVSLNLYRVQAGTIQRLKNEYSQLACGLVIGKSKDSYGVVLCADCVVRLGFPLTGPVTPRM